jgi:hypothetical protein
MVPLGDEAQVEPHFSPFRDSARFASNVPYTRTSFWTHPMEFLGDVGHVESHFFLFGDNVTVGAR